MLFGDERKIKNSKVYILKTNTFHVTKKLLPLLGGNIHCINQRIQDLMALLSHLQYSGRQMPPTSRQVSYTTPLISIAQHLKNIYSFIF